MLHLWPVLSLCCVSAPTLSSLFRCGVNRGYLAAYPRVGPDNLDTWQASVVNGDAQNGGDETAWELAAALSGATGPVDVAIAVAEVAAAAASASFANLAAFDEGPSLWLIHGAALADDAAERWATLDVSASTPLTDAVRTGRPVYLATIDEIANGYPALVDDTKGAGLAATASLPLNAADGRRLGAIGFGWAEAQTFDTAQRRRLEMISWVASSALERAGLHQASLDVGRLREEADARLIQEVFLPRTLPEVPGLEIAALYLPASDAPMGGDWYDVFNAGDDTVFVVGDIAGHGLGPAAMMAQLRNATRAYAVEDGAPSAVLTRLNHLMCDLEPDQTATAIAMRWNASHQELTWASAGHLPILRCRPGEFGFLDPSDHGPVLGADEGITYPEATKILRPGTTLLVFTDGLIERRRMHIDDDLADLQAFVESLDDLAPRVVCDAVLTWRDERGPREDDVCVLAVRVA